MELFTVGCIKRLLKLIYYRDLYNATIKNQRSQRRPAKDSVYVAIKRESGPWGIIAAQKAAHSRVMGQHLIWRDSA